MTAAISYESASEIVEADEHSNLHMSAGQPHTRFVRIEEPDGTIRLIPLSLLHESEQAILENEDLYNSTRAGLAEYAEGRRVSSDLLFADDE